MKISSEGERNDDSKTSKRDRRIGEYGDFGKLSLCVELGVRV